MQQIKMQKHYLIYSKKRPLNLEVFFCNTNTLYSYINKDYLKGEC